MEQETTKDRIYLDKIKLATIFLSKEDMLVNCYSRIVSFIRDQECYDEEVVAQQNEWSNFWREFQMLFDLTKNDYLSKLKDEERKQIKSISTKYSNVKEPLSFKEATMAKDLILKVMSFSGFHDVIRANEDEDFK